jgi:hypothetical protein
MVEWAMDMSPEDAAMKPDAEGLDALAWQVLSVYRQALSAGRMDVAEHLLRALEQLAAPGPANAALEAAYLDLAAKAGRSRSTP